MWGGRRWEPRVTSRAALSTARARRCVMAASEGLPLQQQALGDLLEFVFGLDAMLGPMPADPKKQMRGLLAWLLDTDVAALEVGAPAIRR